MTEKRLSFEEYLRRNPMPTKLLDDENYKEYYCECHRRYVE